MSSPIFDLSRASDSPVFYDQSEINAERRDSVADSVQVGSERKRMKSRRDSHAISKSISEETRSNLDSIRFCCERLRADKTIGKRTEAMDTITSLMDGCDEVIKALDIAEIQQLKILTWSRLIKYLSDALERERLDFVATRQKALVKPGTAKKAPSATKTLCFDTWSKVIIKLLTRERDIRCKKAIRIDDFIAILCRLLRNESNQLYGSKVYNFLGAGSVKSELPLQYLTDSGTCFEFLKHVNNAIELKATDSNMKIFQVFVVRYAEIIAKDQEKRLLESQQLTEILDMLAQMLNKDKLNATTIHALSAFNGIIDRRGCDWSAFIRIKACDFAKKLSEAFLPQHHAYPDAFLNEITQFFRNLLILHHPDNLSSEESGIVEIKETWISIMKALFLNMTAFVDEKRYSEKTHGPQVSVEMCEIYCRTVIQMTKLEEYVDFIQASTSRTGRDNSPAISALSNNKKRYWSGSSSASYGKRAKILISCCDILEKTEDACRAADNSRKSDRSHLACCTNWIRVFKHFLINFADAVGLGDFQSLLKGLLDLLISIKRPEILEHLLDCLAELNWISSISRRKMISDTLEEDRKVLDLLLRNMHLKRLQSSVWKAVAELVNGGFLDESRMRSLGDILRSTLPYVDLSHPESLMLLTEYLTHSEFRERLPLDLFSDGNDAVTEKLAFRQSLTSFLLVEAAINSGGDLVSGLPLNEEFVAGMCRQRNSINAAATGTGDFVSFVRHCMANTFLSPECLALITFLLCEKTPARCVNISLDRFYSATRQVKNWSLLELFLLDAQFVVKPNSPVVTSGSSSIAEKSPISNFRGRSDHIEEMVEFTLNRTLKAVDLFINHEFCEKEDDVLFSHLFHWCFLWCAVSMYKDATETWREKVQEKFHEVTSRMCSRIRFQVVKLDSIGVLLAVLDRMLICATFLLKSRVELAKIPESLLKVLEEICISSGSLPVKFISGKVLAIMYKEAVSVAGDILLRSAENADSLSSKLVLASEIIDVLPWLRPENQRVLSSGMVGWFKSINNWEPHEIKECAVVLKRIWQYLTKTSEKTALDVFEDILAPEYKFHVFEWGGGLEFVELMVEIMTKSPDQTDHLIYPKVDVGSMMFQCVSKFETFGFPGSLWAAKALEKFVTLDLVQRLLEQTSDKLQPILKAYRERNSPSQVQNMHSDLQQIMAADELENAVSLILQGILSGISGGTLECKLLCVSQLVKMSREMRQSNFRPDTLNRIFRAILKYGTKAFLSSSLEDILFVEDLRSLVDFPYQLFDYTMDDEFLKDVCPKIVAKALCDNEAEECKGLIGADSWKKWTERILEAVPDIFVVSSGRGIDAFEVLQKNGVADVMLAVREKFPDILARLLSRTDLRSGLGQYGRITKDKFLKQVHVITERLLSSSVSSLLRTLYKDSAFSLIQSYVGMKSLEANPCDQMEKLTILLDLLDLRNFKETAAISVRQIMSEMKIQLQKLISSKYDADSIKRSVKIMQKIDGEIHSDIFPLLAQCWNMYVSPNIMDMFEEVMRSAANALGVIYKRFGGKSDETTALQIPIPSCKTVELRKAWAQMRRQNGGGSFLKEIESFAAGKMDEDFVSPAFLEYLDSLPIESSIGFEDPGLVRQVEQFWRSPELRFGLSKVLNRLVTCHRYDFGKSYQILLHRYRPDLYRTVTESLTQILEMGPADMRNLAGDCVRKCLQSSPKFLYSSPDSWIFNVFSDSSTKCSLDNVLEKNWSIKKVFCAAEDDLTFGTWIRSICGQFCESNSRRKNENVFLSIAPMCYASEYFAAKIFPYAIAELILGDKSGIMGLEVGKQFNNLITKLLNLFGSPDTDWGKRCECKHITMAILKVMQHLQTCEEEVRGVRRYQLIGIDYRLLSQLAERLGFSYQAIYFSEVAVDPVVTKRKDTTTVSEETMRRMVELVPETDLDWFVDTQLNAYLFLKDVDGVYSLGETVLARPFARVLLAEEEKDWHKLVSMYSYSDALIGESDGKRELAMYNAAVGELGNFTEDFQYECAMKLGKWEDLDSPKLFHASFNRTLYGAIIEMASSSEDLFKQSLDLLRLKLVENETFLSVADNRNSSMEKLAQLFRFEKIFSERKNSRGTASFCKKVLTAMGSENVAPEDLDTNVSFLRALSFGEKVDSKNKEIVLTTLSELICCQAALLRQEKKFQRSLLLISDWDKILRNEESVPLHVKHSHVLEEVKSMWVAGETYLAKHELGRVIDIMKEAPERSVEVRALLSRCLVQVAEFHSAVSGSRSRNVEEMYGEALKEIESSESAELKPLLGHTLTILADYTCERLKNLTEYLTKDKQKNMEKNIIAWRRESVALASNLTDRRSIAYRRTAQTGYKATQQELYDFKERRNELTVNSVELLLRCLELCEERNLEIFKVISIWFDNLESDILADLIMKYTDKIPTHKWLLAWTQLTSRLTTKSDQQHRKALSDLVTLVSQEHPFHTFYTLVALSNGISTSETAKNRIEASKKIIKSLFNSSQAGIFNEMSALAKSYMEFATLDRTILKAYRDHPDRKKEKESGIPFVGKKFNELATFYNNDFKAGVSQGYQIPKVFKLYKHKSLQIPTPTIDVPVDKKADYQTVISLLEFKNEFKIFDGQNCPRVIEFVSSDGVPRKELVKGFDDIRQDAVMEQVFTVANQLLELKKQLGVMRTYRIVPLSPDGGVIQWCEGTMPIRQYLVASHPKYNPNDWPIGKARTHLGINPSEALNKREYLMERYQQVLDNFNPCFRHFFFENYTDPVDWLEKRRMYTRSVAVASMVGHILGLGDRHFSNILIDKITAEVVNIDLGIAFDQGRSLAQPERVPFRLTRDVVDPMGICSIEGTFRRSSRSTLQVLRDARETIVTIVSVLLEDPLSQWEITDTKKQKAQPLMESGKRGNKKDAVSIEASDDSRNQHAVRVIERLEEKLKGIETEKAEVLSTERQVEFLIDEARSIDNLSLIYVGWAAYH